MLSSCKLVMDKGVFSPLSDKCPLCPLQKNYLVSLKPAPVLALSTWYTIYLSFYKLLMYVWGCGLMDTISACVSKKRKLFSNSKIGRHLRHTVYDSSVVRVCGCPIFISQVDMVDIAGKKWTFLGAPHGKQSLSRL